MKNCRYVEGLDLLEALRHLMGRKSEPGFYDMHWRSGKLMLRQLFQVRHAWAAVSCAQLETPASCSLCGSCIVSAHRPPLILCCQADCGAKVLHSSAMMVTPYKRIETVANIKPCCTVAQHVTCCVGAASLICTPTPTSPQPAGFSQFLGHATVDRLCTAYIHKCDATLVKCL